MLILASAASSRVAADASPAWGLSWRAPEACPSEQEIRATVGTMLARSAQSNDASGIQVRAQVQRSPAGFTLDLLLVSRSGRAHEQLVAASCETLAGVVALKVVLAADPAAWFVGMQSRTQPPQGHGVALRFAASAGPGLLPGLGPAVELTGRLQFGWTAMELGAGYGFLSDARHRDHPEVGANVDLFFLSARFCVLPTLASLEFPLCAGPDLGLMRGRGFGVQDSQASVQPWLAVAIGPALRWYATPASALYFGIAGLVSVARPSYRVLDLSPDQLYTPARIGARLQIGAELKFD